jgi:hypothetical protein
MCRWLCQVVPQLKTSVYVELLEVIDDYKDVARSSLALAAFFRSCVPQSDFGRSGRCAP